MKPGSLPIRSGIRPAIRATPAAANTLRPGRWDGADDGNCPVLHAADEIFDLVRPTKAGVDILMVEAGCDDRFLLGILWYPAPHQTDLPVYDQLLPVKLTVYPYRMFTSRPLGDFSAVSPDQHHLWVSSGNA